MNSILKSFAFGIVTAAGLAVSAVSSPAQSATATISGVAAGGGVFDYTITLRNTGTTSLDGFWYAWTLSGNNLSSAISNPGSALGWSDTALAGDTSISWQGNFYDELGAGQSTTFTFDSTESPTQITTSPSGESVAYTGNIGFNQASSGVSTAVFSPTLVSAPEPSSLGIMAVGLLAVLLRAVPAARLLFGILKK